MHQALKMAKKRSTLGRKILLHYHEIWSIEYKGNMTLNLEHLEKKKVTLDLTQRE